MKLDDAYRIKDLDLVQFLSKVKNFQTHIFDNFVHTDTLRQFAYYNAVVYVLSQSGVRDLHPMARIPPDSGFFDKMSVRMAVAPYENDLLVLLFPSEFCSIGMRTILEQFFDLRDYTPTDSETEGVWKTVFDNVIYASPSNSMFSVVLSPVVCKRDGIKLEEYTAENIKSVIDNLTVDEVLQYSKLTFPKVYSTIDATKLEETLNAIKNDL